MNAEAHVRTRSSDPITSPKSVDEESVNEFLDRVEHQLAEGERSIVVDCSLLDKVTSSHIKGLWLAYEACQDRKAHLELVNVSEGLRRVLRALNLTRFFLQSESTSLQCEQRVRPKAEAIDDAISDIVSFLTRSHVNEITAFEVQTVLYEIATNIRLHSHIQADDEFSILVKVDEHKITIRFTDAGRSFDPTADNHNVDLKEAGRAKKRRGYGLALVEGLCSSITYTRTSDQKNQLDITKTW